MYESSLQDEFRLRFLTEKELHCLSHPFLGVKVYF